MFSVPALVSHVTVTGNLVSMKLKYCTFDFHNSLLPQQKHVTLTGPMTMYLQGMSQGQQSVFARHLSRPGGNEFARNLTGQGGNAFARYLTGPGDNAFARYLTGPGAMHLQGI